jgi:hypothetical protein
MTMLLLVVLCKLFFAMAFMQDSKKSTKIVEGAAEIVELLWKM